MSRNVKMLGIEIKCDFRVFLEEIYGYFMVIFSIL